MKIEKRGRPRTTEPWDTHAANDRASSARYYTRNREMILKKAHDKYKHDRLLEKLKKSGRILSANDK